MQKFLLVFTLSLMVSITTTNAQDNRTLGGTNNNLTDTNLGSKGDLFNRKTSVSFTDGISVVDESGPNPRGISNQLFSQENIESDKQQLSDFTWAFSQFIAHEIFHLGKSNTEFLSIEIPDGDDFFTPGSSLTYNRVDAAEGTGTSIDNPRSYINHVTAYIDGSNIYGSTEERAQWLRTFEEGKLKISENDLLPWNTIDGEFNSDVDPNAPIMIDETEALEKYFVAGDERANLNPLLLSFHTIFLREHNRLCDELALEHPNWNDERIYQRARKINGALLQSIVYNEWLPTIGINLPSFTGYKPSTDVRILNVFAGAAFKIANTLINSSLIRMDYEGGEVSQGNISIGDAFYNPLVISYVDGIDPYIKGMATQVQQDLDCKMIDEVRNFQYRNATVSKGTDKAAITINKGRDIGLPSYNQVRIDLGLPRYSSFNNLTSDQDARDILNELYSDINNCDPWVGMLAEDHLAGSIFGQLTSTIIERQFQLLRDGDRFYYEEDPLLATRQQDIASTTLSDVLMRNTGIELMQKNVFTAMPHEQIPNGPSLIPIMLDAVIYPNPVKNTIQAKVYLDIDSDITAKVINYMGHQILTASFSGVRGDNFLRIDLNEACPRGYYNLILESGDEFKVLKFIKD